ncbi:MAG: hypothetical protein Q7U57_02600 [Methylovulum sp.]|nr:hypothetical protein [Methylovulum sp.]
MDIHDSQRSGKSERLTAAKKAAFLAYHTPPAAGCGSAVSAYISLRLQPGVDPALCLIT